MLRGMIREHNLRARVCIKCQQGLQPGASRPVPCGIIIRRIGDGAIGPIGNIGKRCPLGGASRHRNRSLIHRIHHVESSTKINGKRDVPRLNDVEVGTRIIKLRRRHRGHVRERTGHLFPRGRAGERRLKQVIGTADLLQNQRMIGSRDIWRKASIVEPVRRRGACLRPCLHTLPNTTLAHKLPDRSAKPCSKDNRIVIAIKIQRCVDDASIEGLQRDFLPRPRRAAWHSLPIEELCRRNSVFLIYY